MITLKTKWNIIIIKNMRYGEGLRDIFEYANEKVKQIIRK